MATFTEAGGAFTGKKLVASFLTAVSHKIFLDASLKIRLKLHAEYLWKKGL